MIDFGSHYYRAGSNEFSIDKLPSIGSALDEFTTNHRKKIEPWLSAVFQAEHLNLLLGSGFTSAISDVAGTTATGMARVKFDSPYDRQIDKYAEETASRMGRGKPNIEDQFRCALAILGGLEVSDPTDADDFKIKINKQLKSFLDSLLETEGGIATAITARRIEAESILQTFLLSFATRTASRERLHIFTTNYDRLIEHGCDLAGIRTIDRFVGSLNPIFRASRVDVDFHYNPPGIRGEPRFMEGVVRLTKLHGSLDWVFDDANRRMVRVGLPFGSSLEHTNIPKNPLETVMVYPNPAKDFETTNYPYAELFRDLAASICRPNAVMVTYGYGFGDDHINRVLLDMLAISSTHLVVIGRSADARLRAFLSRTRDAQITLLLGTHFSDLTTIVNNYLPAPALDFISARMTEILKKRPETLDRANARSESGEHA